VDNQKRSFTTNTSALFLPQIGQCLAKLRVNGREIFLTHGNIQVYFGMVTATISFNFGLTYPFSSRLLRVRLCLGDIYIYIYISPKDEPLVIGGAELLRHYYANSKKPT